VVLPLRLQGILEILNKWTKRQIFGCSALALRKFLVQSRRQSVAPSHPQHCNQLARKFELQKTESGQGRRNMNFLYEGGLE